MLCPADERGGNMAKELNQRVNDGTEKLNTEKAGKFSRFLKFADRYKGLMLSSFAILVVAVVGMIGIINYNTAYEYSYNGRTLGVVKDKEDVLKIMDLVQSALTEERDIQVVIDQKDDIAFKRVSAMGQDVHIDTSEEVLKRMTYVGDINVKAYSITVNGKHAAVVDSEESARKVLDELKADYTDPGENVVVEDAKFVEDVQIKEVNTDLEKLQKEEEAKKALKTGAVVEKSHVVMAGETMADLAKEYDMSEAEIMELNPQANPRKLEVGSEIKLKEEAPVVTLETSELITYEEDIDFDTKEKKSDKLYEGGTKERPPTIGSGEYIYPVDNYRLSSPFGPRWGRNHNGVDLACPMGTDVKAADGGTVTFAGYKGSFGYLVIIDHQNGMETYYAHNSELLVKEGDKVYQ